MSVADPCDPCREFRRGERENQECFGVRVHICLRVAEGEVHPGGCPCGCADREPGQLERDRALYGYSAIGGATGARVNPATIRPA